MTLEQGADISTIAQFILWLLLSFAGGVLTFKYLWKINPIWKRLAKNLERKVLVVSTESQPMEHEAAILKRVGYFDVEHIAANPKNTDLLHNVSLLVVGYSPSSAIYKKIFDYAVQHKRPLVVFAGNNRLSDIDRDALKQYSFSSLCETDLRLVSDVFAIMSTFPDSDDR